MTQIFKDYSDFIDREDKKINGVSEEFAKEYPDYEKQNATNEACWNCESCVSCVSCKSQKKNNGFDMVIPVIENIHQKVLEAVSNPGAFDMSEWHKCETTHCRAGWVEVLAGEAGKKLASKTSTAFAALQIYHASSSIKVAPTEFYRDNN